METTAILALFALFGGVCARYVTLIGFGLTALALVAILGLANYLFGGVFGGWMLAGAFVALQVGYAVALVGPALASHVRLLSPKTSRGVKKGDFHIKQD